MTVFLVEIRRRGGDEWERVGTWTKRERAERMEKVARSAIDVAEARVVERS